MDQRRLNVGDIVDDYCPRERRITDHAIVAMIDNAIRQTRCTACESEHPYKEARTPRVRRKTAPGALYSEVLANVADPSAPKADAGTARSPEPSEPAPAAAPEPEKPAAPAVEEGPVHRPLIRATLPRPDGGTPSPRPLPEFTVRQSGVRGRFRDDGRFRSGPGGRNGGHPNQARSGRSGSGNPHGRPRHGRPSPHKKRSR
jgi:hypothetical protein